MKTDNELDEAGIETAADHLYAIGLHHHWCPGPSSQPASWRDLDPTGRSEFVGIVEGTIKTFLRHSAGRE